MNRNYDIPPRDIHNRDLVPGDFVQIFSPGNHHDGLHGFYVGPRPPLELAEVWHPYEMWRTNTLDHLYPIVGNGSFTGWHYRSLMYLADGSLCAECQTRFLGANEYLCPICRA